VIIVDVSIEVGVHPTVVWDIAKKVGGKIGRKEGRKNE
jgi:hypothetical protein